MNTTRINPRRRPPPVLETERLILRRPRMEDAEAIFESYARDVEVTRYLNWMPHTSIDQTREVLAEFIDRWKSGDSYEYVLENKDSNELMGMIGLGDEDAKAVIGYVLARPYWGKGYMTEAEKALIRWGLHQGHYQRVHAFCDMENNASSKVMEKAGMQFEGVLRKWCWHPQADQKRLRDCKMYSVIN